MTITAQVPDLELDLAAASAPYTGDAAAEAAPADFRRVVFTSPRTQMVVMTLKPGQQIGSEIHPAADQLFVVVSGSGTVTLNLEAHHIGPGSLIAVPEGTRHNVTAGQGGPLRLVTVYAPPQHPAGTVEHEHASITAQALDLAATAKVDPAALKGPGFPVPDDPTAIPMFIAHRLDDTLRGLAHGTERMKVSRGATGDLRYYHVAHLVRHVHQALGHLAGLVACVKEHFPAEAAELEKVRAYIGLAKSLTPQVKAATTAHLLETTLHEVTHAARHAEVMVKGEPGDVWEFNASHCEKHLAGAVEHAKKLAQQFTDNYRDVSKWLTELDAVASPVEGTGGQHARYGGGTRQMAATISGQAGVIDLRNWEGWRDEPRNDHGQWTREGGAAAAVIEKVTEPIRGEGARGNSRPVSEAEFQQLAAEGRGRLHDIQHVALIVTPAEQAGGISGQAAALAGGIGAQLELAGGGWRDAWRTELRGPHGEWVRGPLTAFPGPAPGGGWPKPPPGIAQPVKIPVSVSHPMRLAPDGLVDPSPESLAIARKMVATEGITPAQHEAVARMVGGNLDLIPPQMRTAMAATHKVRVMPQKDVGKPGVMGVTGAWDGNWEIRITNTIFTAKQDSGTADDEDAGDFVMTERPADDDIRHLALRHTVTHEWGHALFEQGQITAGNIYTVPGEPDAMARHPEAVAERDITEKIVVGLGGPGGGPAGMKKHQAQFEKAIHALSMYGSTSPPEAMAEAYTAYALNGQGANHTTLARTAGADFLRQAEQNFAATDAGKGMTVNLAATADRPYTGCSGLPASPADFRRLYGTPEAKAAAARAWGLPAPAGFAAIGEQFLELAGGWRDAWRTELRGPHGEWVRAETEALNLHKLVRGAANPFVGAELPDTLTREQKTAIAARAGRYLNAAGPKVPAMISSGDHLDFDGKPPTLFNENDPGKAGLLADIDWNGHMSMSNEVAEDIQEALEHPDQPVRVPAALTVPLHEFIHATVPAGQKRSTNGDKAAYQDPTMAYPNIEEAFTELGAIQHAARFFDANGLGNRKISVPGSPPGATMDDLAGIASQPGHIRDGTAWGRYKDITAQAYEWVSLIAQQNTGKPESDPATQREIQRLSDEVNAVGTAAKPQVMAQHAVSDMLLGMPSDQTVLDSAKKSILDNWGGQDPLSMPETLSQARAAAQQRIQELQAERGAA